jgi:proteasome alpha subunit
MKSSAYDRSATMFSPDGRLYQVEYASKIVEQGTLGAGLIFSDGVLLAANKRPSSRLLNTDSIEKVFKLDDHIGAISAGLVGDARRLVQMARKDCQENQMLYDEKILVEIVVKNLSAIKQVFTQYAGMRPFGVSFIVGGVDESGARLFETEPSGALAEYKAVAIGKGKKEVMAFLEKDFKENLDLEGAVRLLGTAFEKGMGENEKLDVYRVDFAVITKNGFERLNKNQLKSIFGKRDSKA